MPEPAFPVTRRYAAFLSYRHADNREEGRRWAEWLHQALETYEVPRDLAGQPNLRGTPVPASLYPVFRDEEELPADADLSQNIRRALENSELLIVLCSPRACQSRFVAEEIRLFKELGKSERILALLIDGEPNASDDPAKAAQQGITPAMECFPEPLRFGVPTAAAAVSDEGSDKPPTAPPPIDWTQRTEPIAADVRPQNLPLQGYTSAAAYRTVLEKAHAHSSTEVRRLEKTYAAQLELARLKIVAGALGVPLGQLRERDAVYRAKKFRRLATILCSLALLALGAAGVAIWQGTEAIKQERASRRNEQAARSAEAEANQQKTRAEAGEKAALAAKERAVASKKAADELVSFMQYDLRDTLGTVGRLDMMEGINARILRYHKEHPPDDADQAARNTADREHAAALIQQGDILLAGGQLAAALKSYQEGLAIAQQIAAKDPDSAPRQHDLSLSFNYVGNAQEAQGDLPEALKSNQASLVIARQLAVKDPDNALWQRSLLASFIKVGDVQTALGDLPGALKSYEDGLVVSRQLVAKDPSNTDWQRSLSVSLERVGDVQTAQGDLPEALKSYQDSLVIARQLAAQNSGNALWQRDLSVSLTKVGDVQTALGDLPGALASYQDSLVIARQLTVKDPGNADWQLDLAFGERNVGTILFQENHPARARDCFEHYREIVDRLAAEHSSNYLVLAERANARCALFNCVDRQDSAGKLEARRLLDEAANILHGLEKSPGLQAKHAELLKRIEAQSSALAD